MRTLAVLAIACTSLWAADQKDVEFARPGGKPLLVDLHVPDGAGPFPAAILIHGGGFDEGSRSTNVRPLFDVLAGAGFAWFSIEYRMAPEFRFPQASEDVATAVRWLKSHSAEYHVDTQRIVLIGESAGGFLVNYSGTHETPETKIAAVVDMYGPVDYGKLAELRRDHPERFNMTSINRHAANGGGIHFFGAEQLDAAGLAKLHGISPIFAVHKSMPPFLAIHGTKDDQVVYEQSTEMCDAMHKVGAVCDLITIEGGGHGMSGWRAPEMQHWKPEMIAWLRKTLRAPGAAAWVPLFDGKSLDGWEYNPAVWTLQDGALRGTGQYGQIFTKGNYGSFRLLVTARVVDPEVNTGNGHLGILFWGERSAPGTWGTSRALQVQPPHGAMWDYQVNKAATPIRVIPRQNLQYHDWHTTELITDLKTASLRMAVDGIEIIRYRHDDPSVWKPGPIGMQLHQATSIVEYKDIQVETDPREDRLLTVK